MAVEATVVYILMRKDYRVSRNRRAAWYLSHLNHKLAFSPKKSWEDLDENAELEVVSVLPPPPPPHPSLEKPGVEDEAEEGIVETEYQITNKTRVVFLASQYKLVVALDQSPSSAFVDIHTGLVISDAQFDALRKVLVGITRPFHVPGTKLTFSPKIYLSVLANSPFMSCSVPQVLLQGVILDELNVGAFLDTVHNKLMKFENLVAECTKSFMGRKEGELTGGVWDDIVDRSTPSRTAIQGENSDVGLVTLLRYSLLSLQLLPDRACRLAIVITDGMTGTPDPLYLDALLSQLRNATVACSFLQVATPFHPQNGFGFLPNTDVLQFLATATFGAYLETCPDVKFDEHCLMNIYHQAFLCWDFQKGLDGFRLSFTLPPKPKCKGAVAAGIFLQDDSEVLDARHMSQSFLRKRQLTYDINAPLAAILALRLREGYTIKNVQFAKDDTRIEVCLALPWRFNVRIEYCALSAWPLASYDAPKALTHIEISVEGGYHFLHDLSLPQDSGKSRKNATVKKFRQVLHSLSQTDQFLVHMQSFSSNPAYYTLPNSVVNRVPLYRLRLQLPLDAHNALKHQQFELYVQNPSKDAGFSLFTAFWKPILMLDINVWQKWLHTHRVGLLLIHDRGPLPKHLHTANMNGRFSVIPCRQAADKLATFLSDWSSFVLMENHSYIQLLPQTDGENAMSASFYLLRVVMRSPCVILWLAFQGGTPGSVRHEIEKNLVEAIKNLKGPVRSTIAREESPYGSARIRHNSSIEMENCCVMLHHPVEKILIRYDRAPIDYLRFSNDVNSAGASFYATSPTSNLYTALSKYLYHQRIIWALSPICGSKALEKPALARVLSQLTKIRIEEGFHFANVSQGIVNLVVEIAMKGASDPSTINSCAVQYLIFPPHLKATRKDSSSDIDTDDADQVSCSAEGNSSFDGSILEGDTPEIQLVVECWVTPQDGQSYGALGTPEVKSVPSYLLGRSYQALAHSVYPSDQIIVSTLLTFESLITLPELSNADEDDLKDYTQGFTSEMINGEPTELPPQVDNGDCKMHIHMISHKFDLVNLLHWSQQVLCLLPTLKNRFVEQQIKEGVAKLHELEHSNSTQELAKQTTPMNQILFTNFVEGLQRLHDTEINLSAEECSRFTALCMDRDVQKADAKPDKENQSAFAWPDEWKSLNRDSIFVQNVPDSSVDDCCGMIQDCCIHHGGSKTHDMTRSSPFILPRWKCMIKSNSSSQCFLTICPATYTDLLHLYFPKPSNEVKSSLRTSACGRLTDTDSPDSDLIHASRSRSSTLSFTGNQRARENTIVKPTLVHSPLNVSISQLSTENIQDNLSSAFRSPNTADAETDAEVGRILMKSQEEEEVNQPAINAIPLPMFIFNCSLNNITRELLGSVWKGGPSWENDLVIDKTQKESLIQQPEESDTSDEIEQVSIGRHREESDDFSQTLDPVFGTALNLKVHYAQVMETYHRSYIRSMYRCLQNGLGVDPNDVQAAVDEFCEESMLEIDITSFLKLTCGHVPASVGRAGLIETEAKIDADNVFNVNVLKSIQVWESSRGLHQVIKNRFSEVVSQVFRKVPTSKENNLYYFCSSPPRERAESLSSMDQVFADESTRMNFSAITAQDAVSVGPSDVRAGTEFSRFCSSDDETSSKNIEEEVMIEEEDDAVPLFINLTCSVKNRENGKLISKPIADLPTCLNDIFESILLVLDNDDEIEIDLRNIYVSLDFIFLTLPELTDLKSAVAGGEAEGYLGKTPDVMQEIKLPDSGSLNAKLDGLPEFQYEKVRNCIDEVNWLLRDEIVCALHRTGEVTDNALDYVVDHVRNSSNSKINCIHHDVKLQFVFGPEPSLKLFTDEFEAMNVDIDGCQYQVVKEGALYFYRLKPFEHDVNDFSRVTGTLKKSYRRGKKKQAKMPMEDQLSESSASVKQTPAEGADSPELLDDNTQVDDDVDALRRVQSELEPFPDLQLTRTHSSLSFPLEQSRRLKEELGTENWKQRHGSGGYFTIRESKTQRTSTPDIPFSHHNSSVCSLATEAGYDGYEGSESGDSDSDSIEHGSQPSVNFQFEPIETSPVRKSPDIISQMAHCFSDLWLIVKILPPPKKGGEHLVTVNFHSREIGGQAYDDGEGKRTLYTRVINNVREISRRVNQRLLLEDLYESRTCHRVLVQPSDETWSGGLFNRKMEGRDDDESDSDEAEESGNLWCPEISPGHFECDLVWKRNFPLHPRLKTASGKSSMMDKVKGILDKFSVKNRRDMYVYMESTTKNVFYLISREVSVERSEILNPMTKRGALGGAAPSSARSYPANQKMQDCIELSVYGIQEVGDELKQQLAELIQKRLDDATLEQMEVLLLRNPQLKLNSEDVHFIQPVATKPRYQIRIELKPYFHSKIAAIRYYLSQNLLQFLSHPNFMDTNPLNQFIDYSENPPTLFEDGQVFLFNGYRRSSARDVGLCCIGLKALPPQLSRCSKLKPDAWQGDLTTDQLENDLTEVVCHHSDPQSSRKLLKTSSSTRLTLQSSSIVFLIWSRGDDDMSFLSERLKTSVQHSLLDFIMENFLTAPICQMPSHEYLREKVVQEIDAMHSEPASENDNATIKKQSLMEKLRYKMRSFSFSKAQNAKQQSTDTSSNKADVECLLQQLVEDYEDGVLGNLNPVFTDSQDDDALMTICGLFDFCVHRSVPSTTKQVVGQLSRYPVEGILTEFSTFVSQHLPDTICKLFRQNDKNKFVTASLFKSDGRSKRQSNWVLLARNNAQWRSFLDDGREPKPSSPTQRDPKASQKFIPLETHVHGHDSDTQSSSKDSSKSKSFQLCVPRQKFLLLKATDKKLTLYTYNLHPTIQSSLSSTLQKLSQWHNARSHLQTSIVMQKMGLFHHYRFGDLSSEPFSNDTNPFIVDEKSAEELIRMTKPKLSSAPSAHRPRSTSSALRPTSHFNRTSGSGGGGVATDEMTTTPLSPSTLEIQIVNDVLRDAFPLKPMHMCSYGGMKKDMLQKHGKQLLDVRHFEKMQRDKSQRLDEVHYYWTETMGPTINVPITGELLRLLKKNARLIHFVSSPLLFSPLWRESLLRNNSFEGRFCPKQILSAPEPTWHRDVRQRFVQEYVQYMQSLGFVLVQTRCSTPKRQIQGRSLAFPSPNNSPVAIPLQASSIRRESTEQDPTQVMSKYLQRSTPAGIILVELAWTTGDLSQQRRLFTVKLFVIDFFHNLVGNGRQLQIKLFLQEVDRLKDMTHLNSFSHDFHLRHLTDHISGRTSILPKDFHVASFAADFGEYFKVGPRWARNQLTNGVISVNLANMSCSTVYEYLLSKDKQFNLAGKRLKPVELDFMEAAGELNNAAPYADYALTQHSVRRVNMPSTEIAIGPSSRRPAEEVDVGLIIFYNEKENHRFDLNSLSLRSKSDLGISPNSHNLVLQFYLVGTSRRNLFPRMTENQIPSVTLTEVSSDNQEIVSPTSESSYRDLDTDGVVVTTKRARSESFNLTKVTTNDNSVSWTCKTFGVGMNQQRTAAGVILEKEMDVTQDRILRIVLEAKKHCRREDLWRRLLKGECSDVVKLEFGELLELMKSTSAGKRLVDIDPQLRPILDMNLQWFHGLAKYLAIRFGESNCKLFESADKTQQYYIILNPKNLKIFVALKLNFTNGDVDLQCLYQDTPKTSSTPGGGGGNFVVQNESGTTLFNASKSTKSVSGGNATTALQHSDILNEIAMHELVEDTINAILYYLWSSIL